MSKLAPKGRNLATVIVLALLAGACAHPGQSGVKIKGFDADLVFGVKEPAKDTAPANIGLPGGQGVDPNNALGDLALPPQTFAPLSNTKRPPVSNKAAVDCPDAALNAFPAEPAPIHMAIDKRPKVGVYRWKKKGFDDLKGVARYPIGGFEQRIVRNVKDTGKSTNVGTANVPGATNPPGVIFQFDTVQPSLDGRVTVTTWQVDTSPQSVTENAGNGVPDQRVGSAERGIVIKSISTFDSAGNPKDSFAPSSGLLLLPLDVREGEQFQSAAVGKNQTYSFKGQVKPRQRVDACGTILDGWPVVGHMTLSGQQMADYDYTVIFATQFGGIPIAESIHQTTPKEELMLTQTIGQVDPDPLPAG